MRWRCKITSEQALCGTRLAASVLAIFLLPAAVAQNSPGATSSSHDSPDVVLHGTVTGRQNNTYIEDPFTVPAGTTRVTLTFTYTGKEQHTTLDLGLLDPHGIRCWSGGNKSTLTVSLTDATPSCLPGRVDAGTWKLLLGVPNVRPAETSSYTASLFFTRSGRVADQPAILREPLRSGAAWYRGDLHTHTAHSDGSCLSQRGKSVPCPLFLTAEAATKRGLDFIAITDHNATSHYADQRELQPYFDSLLLIPGREITTFQGHANLFGTTDFVDFRVGTQAVPDEGAWIKQAAQQGAIVSINHPNAPSGEICMGCGWLAKPPVDMHSVTSIEAINGGISEGPYAGVSFWEGQLNAGFHLTGIGGSDNHNATKPAEQAGSVGSPTTVVYAPELSVPGILQGIRSGRVFVDRTGSRDRILDVTAHAGEEAAVMGGSLRVLPNAAVRVDVHVIGCAGSRVEAIVDGHADAAMPAQAIAGRDATAHFDGLPSSSHWVRFNVLDAEGKLQLLGNPIYLTR